MKAFIDESARKGYLVCAVVVATGDLEGVRKDLRSLRKPGASRIHMATESPQFRRQLLSAVTAMPLAARIYEATLAGRPERDARDHCLHALVEDLISDGVTHATFESCDQDRQDRVVVARALRKAGEGAELAYTHQRPNEEELLWLPDILAWAHGAGGDWRRRASPVIDRVRRLGP